MTELKPSLGTTAGDVAAELFEHRRSLSRHRTIDIARFERLTADLEALIRRAASNAGGGLPHAERMLLLDEAMELRAALDRELADVRAALTDGGRRRQAATSYQRVKT